MIDWEKTDPNSEKASRLDRRLREDGFRITTNFRLNLHYDERDDRRYQCEITKDGMVCGFAVEDTADAAIISAAAKAGYHSCEQR